MPALAEHARVELEELAPQANVHLGVLEIAVRRSAQFVSGAMLMDHPGDFARMPSEVGRKPSGDQEIDGFAIARRKIEQTPCRGLREELLLRLGSKRQRDEIDVMTALSQHVDEGPDVQLGAAGDKRHVSVGDEDALRLQNGN